MYPLPPGLESSCLLPSAEPGPLVELGLARVGKKTYHLFELGA